jgi:DNA-directed RNA polymerase subunit RPC12/RpoP
MVKCVCVVRLSKKVYYILTVAILSRTVKRMQTEADAPTLNDGGRTTESRGFTCEECGKVYEKPILANIISEGQTQEYYACPRCMTKVSETPKTIQEPQPPAQTVQAKKTTAAEKEVVAGCAHYFGYLRKREKDKSFPDECLTCSKMVDCLMQ